MRNAGTMMLAGAILWLGLAVRPAAASVWCGENGLVRFSFTAGDSLVQTLQTGEPEGGVTIVDVYAWLTDMEPVARRGDAFMRLGGIELELQVTGAEASIISQEFTDAKALNVGAAPGALAVGFHPGLRVQQGRVLLVHWKLLFQGRPQDVQLGLDGSDLRSCATLAGCPESGTQALYAGADAANQLDCLFGAGYVPAWINPTGEPDHTPVTGKVGWREVGVFQAR
ncbi:MAG: hypothetical protein IPK64_07640 [bacterium]|nr:hypothetical protein [bacterium]